LQSLAPTILIDDDDDVQIPLVDDSMATQLLDFLHKCEDVAAGNSDECARVLDIAKCFKVEIHKLKWAPSMELIVAEILAEV
jgi:hypothetical protein